VQYEVSGKDCLQFVNHYFSTVFRGSVATVPEYFGLLAATCRDEFRAALVTVWDNNVYGEHLVLLASSPAREPALGSSTIHRQGSLTGLAIERCDVVWHTDLSGSIGDRRFLNPGIIDQYRLRRMVSIPVTDPFNIQFVTCVIDLCFESDFPAKSRQVSLLQWLTTAIALSRDHLLFRVDDGIRRSLGVLTPKATGMAQLFEDIAPELSLLTRSSVAALFRLDSDEKLLLLAASDASPTATTYAKCIDRRDPGLSTADREMHTACVGQRNQFVLCEQVSRDQEGSDALRSYVRIATPLVSEAGKVLGVLQCNLNEADAQTRSFSSIDVEILDSFATNLSPLMERFNRVRESGLVISLLEKITTLAVDASELYELLQRIIEALASSFNAVGGTIFVCEESSDTFRLVVRAEHGLSVSGQRQYDVGSDLAAHMVEGRITNLKSSEERTTYLQSPTRFGGFVSDVDQSSPERSAALLGVPITHGKKLLGAWKLEYVSPSPSHPQDYFTDEDEQIARIISSFLAYLIEHDRYRKLIDLEFKSVAKNSVEIENARTEQDAILAVMTALENTGWANVTLSMYDPVTRDIVDYLDLKGPETKPQQATRVSLDSDNVVAVVLRNNSAEFMPDFALVSRRPGAVGFSASGTGSRYVLPLRLDDEMIGTLQVDTGHRSKLAEDEGLVLHAFASHLAVAISRIRSMDRMLELTSEVMSGSRFIVAEALSGVVVHSLGHKLNDIVRRLEADLERKEIRDREPLFGPLRQWHAMLTEGQRDLNNALLLVKGGAAATKPLAVDLHPVIQESIDTWITYLRTHKVRVDPKLDARNRVCMISPYVFREILSVLIVNAVQAHAKRIEIKTFNEERTHIGTNFIRANAFCLDFSDDGNGLATDTPEEIFKANYTTKPEKFGTGLGLFIARRLARDAGGEIIALTERPNKGVTFRLGLPTVSRQGDS